MLPSFDNLIISVQKIKNINWFFPIDDQQISQSDWTRDKTDRIKIQLIFSRNVADQRIL